MTESEEYPEYEKLSNEEYDRITNEMSECPFCKGKSGDVMVIHFHHWVCCCQKCDARGPVAGTPQKALELWNRREA